MPEEQTPEWIVKAINNATAAVAPAIAVSGALPALLPTSAFVAPSLIGMGANATAATMGGAMASTPAMGTALATVSAAGTGVALPVMSLGALMYLAVNAAVLQSLFADAFGFT